MIQTTTKHTWYIHIKGNKDPFKVIDVADVVVHPDADIVKVVDGAGSALAIFPLNAVSAILRNTRG